MQMSVFFVSHLFGARTLHLSSSRALYIELARARALLLSSSRSPFIYLELPMNRELDNRALDKRRTPCPFIEPIATTHFAVMQMHYRHLHYKKKLNFVMQIQ